MVRKLIVVFVTGLMLATACSPAQNVLITTPISIVDTTIVLTDGLDRMVSLPAPAQRVVSLAPSNTEILFAIGAGTQVVGRDMFSNYPASVASVQDIGGSMGEYNLEDIVALQPDLVLAGGINPPELVNSLEQLGLTVYFLPNPISLEEMYTNLDTVGKLTGRENEASVLIDSLKVRVAAVDAVIQPLNSYPSVYYEIDASNPSSPYTYGPGSFGDLLIQRAGGINIGSQLEGLWATISLEQLVTDNPDIVILGDAAWGETPEKFTTRSGMSALDAVENNQVFPFDDNLVSRPGPRLVDGLEALAKLLHPDLFK